MAPFCYDDDHRTVVVRGVTKRDLRMARRISELGLDTANRDVIAPFWAALLTGDASNVDGDGAVDPSKRVPAEPDGA